MKNEQTTKKQHPVPQNIMEVEFKLIGDMTIRQFAYVAGGGFVAYLVFASSIPTIFRWPLALLVAFFALGLAFLPIEERGFDEWIKAFIVACYSPTQYIWKDREEERESTMEKTAAEKVEIAKKDKEEVSEEKEEKEEKEDKEDKEDKEVSADGEKLEEKAKDLSKDLDGILSFLRGGKERKIKDSEIKEKNITLRNRLESLLSELETLKKRDGSETDEKTIAYYRDKISSLEEKLETIEEETKQKEQEKDVPPSAELEEKFKKQVEALREEREEEKKRLEELRKELATKEKTEEQRSEEHKNLVKKLAQRQKELARLERERNQAMKELARFRKGSSEEEETSPKEDKPERDEEKDVRKEKAQREKPAKDEGKTAPIIDGSPNVINGVVRDEEGSLLEGVMIVVEDEDGDPVRALRTNRLGQFVIATPLSDGEYTVKVEGKQRDFTEKTVTLDGRVLDPILFKEQ